MKIVSKSLQRVVVTCAAATLFTPLTYAQCPAGVTDPATVLFGTWTFSMRGYLGVGSPFASAGQFNAALKTINGTIVTTLTITQSTSDGIRLEVDTGSYQVFPDCSGGTLTFKTSSRPFQFDFWFDEFFTEIRFVSTNGGIAVKGTAEAF
jgi:hypothetical protein